jgi:hypothetical protein
MSRRARVFTLVLLSLFAASSVLAETRGVAILLKRDKEKGTLVTIHSDVKEEKQTDIPLPDAVKIVEKIQGWGSSVLVCIVADHNPRAGLSDGIPELPELRKLLQAVDENVWLSLVYLRIGDAKGGDDLVKHFIEATGGK